MSIINPITCFAVLFAVFYVRDRIRVRRAIRSFELRDGKLMIKR